MKRNGTPSIKTLAAALADEWRYMRAMYDKADITDGDISGIDCRLRVHDGEWQLLTGSSDYDQDHRGHWGCAFIPWGRSSMADIARDLIDQILDSMAMEG